MSHSLNEIEARVKCAARGAKLPWGMAEEAAKGVRWLASHGLEGPAVFMALLIQNDGIAHSKTAPAKLDGEWAAPGGPLCPIASGVTLNDCADLLSGDQSVVMKQVSYPLLVLPFAAWAAVHLRRPVKITWQDVSIVTDGEGISVSGPNTQINAARTARLTCVTAVTDGMGFQQPGSRGTVAPNIWAGLDEFAKRTYAPATDASRRLGAGAGEGDND